MLRRALVLLACASIAALAAAGSAPAPAAAAKRTCIVHRYTAAGKKIVYRVSVYRYKVVRRNGERVRTIVKRRLALRGSCRARRACVKVKVGATGRLVIVTARRRVLVRVPRGERLVMRRLTRRVPVLGRCVKPKALPDAALGVPVRITLLPGSKAVLNFGAFTRDAPVAGTLRGYSPQPKIDIRKDIPVVFTAASLTIGSTPIYIDGDCAGRQTASVRTGRGTTALLDDSRESTSLLDTSGAVTATTYLKVRLPLELRDGETGCDKPYIDTQYSEWPLQLRLTGRLDPKTGLAKLRLTSAPMLATDLTLCLNPGPQNQPCTGFLVPLPIYIATDVSVKVDVNAR